MNHIALYRTWRPQRFEEVVGQGHITRTLQNSLASGRISHAYLFSGPRGTGKTSVAKIMAKAVNCAEEGNTEPCNSCAICQRITEGSMLDVFEIDAASNRGIDEIRDIREQVKYAPTEVRYKVYIIDEVHMLTTEAFNALLKTLEEPPAHVIFILATTAPSRLPATIISRCQRYDFHRVSLEDQVARLGYICEQEGLNAEAEALQFIARQSEGGMRDALSILDQMISYAGKDITYKEVVSVTGGIDTEQFKSLAEAIFRNDAAACLQYIERLMNDGKSVDKCLESLIHYYRDLLLIKLVPESKQQTEQILDPALFATLAAQYDQQQIFEIIETLNHYQVEMKYASQPLTLFEIAVLKVCSMPAEKGDSNWSEKADAEAKRTKEQLRLLTERVDMLAKEIAVLKSTGQAIPSAGQTTVTDQGARSQAMSTAQARQVPASSVKPSFSLPLKKHRTAISWEPFLQGSKGALYTEICSKWSRVLAKVREQKVTLHAWLIDGEPVSVANDVILVAFKHEMHHDTTAKPENKQLIEDVLHDILGKAYSLETIMRQEWEKQLAAQSPPPEAEPAEEFQLEPEPEQTGPHQEEWINAALDIFGEQLVTIKEDNPQDE